jgi:hypothetical protein
MTAAGRSAVLEASPMVRLKIILALSLLCTTVDCAALFAHVLELPNKLRLTGPLWLAVQQNLYSGWGPALGPFEVGAVGFTWVLVFMLRGRDVAFNRALTAVICLSVLLAAFFLVVRPVNEAFAVWTPQTLPADWQRYRLQWELGHAGRAVLCAVSLACLIGVAISLRDRPMRNSLRARQRRSGKRLKPT